ncbi:MAG: DUF1294 domain-containing protein [Pseudomonadota bacterium]
MFIGVWVSAASLWPVRPLTFVFYVGVSVWTFLMYAFDKAAAQRGAWRTPESTHGPQLARVLVQGARRGAWRTPESTLHLLGLAGGWPGALLAQQLLRHKSSKPSFVAMFWVTVIANIAAFMVWHARA